MKCSSNLMKQKAGGNGQRHCAFVIIFLAVVFSTAYVAPIPNLFGSPLPQAISPEKAQAPDTEQEEVRQALSIAEAKHELVKVLISQGRFDRVLPEMRAILDLKLPDKYETSVAKSACIIANDLAESRQFSLAHAVLDETLHRMKLNENKASILKIQAYVYKTEGNLDKALDCLQRAIELEKQRNR